MKAQKTQNSFNSTGWLPITRREVLKRGWDYIDVILISGDAYVDHPAFGTAMIGRLIENMGLRVAIVPQPNWQDDLRDFKKLGKPRLFFGVTSGCMDSMVNHYTANKRKRSDDAYSPGGQAGLRPDYAAKVYSKILKKLYPETPVVLGGIEASLRRLTHYDYWQDQLHPSILQESGADLLIYGMGEPAIMQLIKLLERDVPFENIKTLPQTAYMQPENESLTPNKKWETLELASHAACLADKKVFARNFKYIEQESNKKYARRLIQKLNGYKIVVNPPYPDFSEKKLDSVYDLPYTRLPHPKYRKRGEIPAYNMIRHSVTTHRGCFGGCSFCTISAHQGKFVVSRSEKSILKEIEKITRMPDFKGYISDLGGPSANMYRMKGKDQAICERCLSPSCLHPTICHNLDADHKPLLDIYGKSSAHEGVKKVFVSSGIRYDLFLGQKDDEAGRCGHREYMETLISNHVSGRLKVAPEHSGEKVLKLMRKPSFALFHKFRDYFYEISKKSGLSQQLIPYFISSHPGSTLEDMAELAVETKKLGFRLEQVQDFTPTPMTLATVMYYSGYDPYTLKPVHTAKTKSEKRAQNRFFFWYKKENRGWIAGLLKKAGRIDLLNALLNSKLKGTKKA